jgi:hypothetical protein
LWSDDDYDEEIPSYVGVSADEVGKKTEEDLYPDIMIIEDTKNPQQELAVAMMSQSSSRRSLRKPSLNKMIAERLGQKKQNLLMLTPLLKTAR